MKKYKVVIYFLLLLYPIVSPACFKEEAIISYYPEIVQGNQAYFPGPLAEIISQYAMVRQLHEDGNNNRINYSIPGLSVGHPITPIVKETYNENIKISTIRDADGMRLFSFKGEKANVHSCIVISRFFDYIIANKSFIKPADQGEWEEIKDISNEVEQHKGHFIRYAVMKNEFDKKLPVIHKILSRCNTAYGPRGSSLNKEVIKFSTLFDESLKRKR